MTFTHHIPADKIDLRSEIVLLLSKCHVELKGIIKLNIIIVYGLLKRYFVKHVPAFGLSYSVYIGNIDKKKYP